MPEDVSSTKTDSARILIVGDRPEERAPLRRALEGAGAGYQVQETATLAGAREALGRGRVNLVLCALDHGAGKSGIDLLWELAPGSPEIAVVMWTREADTQRAIECLRAGAFDCVPFKADELPDIIARALGRQQRMIAERRRGDEQDRTLSRFATENPNPVLRLALNGLVLYANTAGQTICREWKCPVGEKVPPFFAQFVSDVLSGIGCDELQVDIAGRTHTFAITPVQDADYVYLYGHDITRLKETETELIRLKEQAQAVALHDPLTGLPNRTLLEDRFVQGISQCMRSGKKLAVVFIDLDNFKQINDARGHNVGDRILVQVAQCVAGAVRKTDTVARWGGDELVLLLAGLTVRSQVHAACERIQRIVQEELARNPASGTLTLSMGVAICPDDAAQPERLLQQADFALYRAKARGRNAIVLYGESGEVAGIQP